MKKIQILIKELHLENFFLQFFNGENTADESFADRIAQSFEDIFETLEKLYDGADREDEHLFNAISAFAGVHDDTYFQAGLLIGASFMRQLEKEYNKHYPLDFDELLNQETKESGFYRTSDIFQQIIELRTDNALEESIRLQDALKDEKRAESSQQCLQGVHFTQEQWHVIDKILAENNAAGAEYGRLAYKQGFLDAFTLLKELTEESRHTS